MPDIAEKSVTSTPIIEANSPKTAPEWQGKPTQNDLYVVLVDVVDSICTRRCEREFHLRYHTERFTTTTTLSWSSSARWPFEFRDLTDRTVQMPLRALQLSNFSLGKWLINHNGLTAFAGFALHAKDRSIHIGSIGFSDGIDAFRSSHPLLGMYGPPPYCKRKLRSRFGLRKCIRPLLESGLLARMECAALRSP
jgi:hypothetical protein